MKHLGDSNFILAIHHGQNEKQSEKNVTHVGENMIDVTET